MNELVTAAFYNPVTGLTRNIAKLKEKNPQLWGIPQNVIRDILDANIAIYHRNHSKGIHAKERVKYRASYVGQLLQADIAYLASPRNTAQSITLEDAKGEDRGFVLIIVDTYSRYIWAYPVASTKEAPVRALVEKTIEFIREFFYGGYNQLRFTVLTDGGKEFSRLGSTKLPNVVHKIAKEHASLAEAAIYRLRTKLKYLDHGKGAKRKLDFQTFVSLIQSLNLDSNANAIFEKEAEPKIDPVKPPEKPAEFSQGDLVRVEQESEIFSKKSSLSAFSEKMLIVLDSIWFPQDSVWGYKIGSPDGEYISARTWFGSQLLRVPPGVPVSTDQNFTKAELKALKMQE